MKSLVKCQGKRIRKIRQIKNAYSFELHGREEKQIYLLIIPDKAIFVTKKSWKAEEGKGFYNVIKKHLTGQLIEEINQHGFDRIVEIDTPQYKLIAEIFGKGNLILVKKPENSIVIATDMRTWAKRKIKPNAQYLYPPSFIDPFKLSIKEIESYLEGKDLVRVLATEFGFGGPTAEKICERLELDKNSRSGVIAGKIHSFLSNIWEYFPEIQELQTILEKEFDEYLNESDTSQNVAKERINSIKESQQRKLEELMAQEKTYRMYAEAIYNNYEIFNDKLTMIKELQEQKLSLEDIEKRLEVKFLPEKTLVLIKNVPIDYKKTLEENTNEYYTLSKKAKEKIRGLREAMEMMGKKDFTRSKSAKEPKEAVIRQWYEKFRWMHSSDGFLLVSGKDAKTNELLIRKHMKPSDLVFHTDITGSPFTLIKNPEKKEIPESTIREAAEFCGIYSKAWKIGISLVDVYYISPDQVKKEGGLPQGSFMIYGKREWIRQIPMEIGIGVKENEIIFGPSSFVNKLCKRKIKIIPGEKSIKELYQKIKAYLPQITIEILQKMIPYGKGKIAP